MWLPGGSIRANYPNFSHGTSGVAYFLATLYQRSREQAFLDGALAGVKYLDAVATRRNGARAIFHVTGGGEDRFYLSWCHGPVGTARLFYRLLQITGDQQWRTWIDELTAWLVASGAPEQQSAGYWNNISQCCGNVGIGQYTIDLTRHYPTADRREPARSRRQEHDVARDGRCGGIAMGAGGEPRVSRRISSRRRDSCRARPASGRFSCSSTRSLAARRGRAVARHAVGLASAFFVENWLHVIVSAAPAPAVP